MKEVADFKVYTKGAGSGELRVQVKGPSMHAIISTKATIVIFFLFYSALLCKVSWFELNFVFSGGGDEPVKVQELGDGVYECDYYPIFPGKYIITITWGGHAIPRR